VGTVDCWENCHSGIGNCKSFYDGKGFVKAIFETFVNNPLYQFVAKISLVLAITLYGFGYFFGLSSFTQSEIITRIIRFSFIYFILSPSGWDFFNNFIIKFFKTGVDSILFLVATSFEPGGTTSELSLAVASGNYTDKSLLFSSSFSNIEMLFSDAIFSKILGLAFSSWVGFVYLYLVLSSVINYVVAAFSAMVIYLNSQIFMSLVFCFFPLVILFMFFEKTKKTFDNWVNLLIGFAGQQLFLVTTLSFFNMLIYVFIKTVFNYKVCMLPIFSFDIAGIPLGIIPFWKVPSTSLTTGINIMNENMPNFYSIMSLYIIGVLMGKFVTGMVSVGGSLFGGMNIGGGLAGVINGAMASAGESAKGILKKTGAAFGKGMARRMGGRAIEEYAKEQKEKREEREKKRNAVFDNSKEKASEAMSDYKKSDEFMEKKKEIRDGLATGNEEYKKQKNNEASAQKELAQAQARGDVKAQKKAQGKITEARKQMKGMEDRAIGEHLEQKHEEFTREAAIGQIGEQYKDEIQEAMDYAGDGRNFSDLSKEEKHKMQERFGIERGFIKKKAADSATPPPTDNKGAKVSLGGESQGDEQEVSLGGESQGDEQ
ncbi:MAG: type IV secretion system protein, partial [Rickettsiales bacterium]|nr:type IV secretion system protein [Rickettsiales bacterium]